METIQRAQNKEEMDNRAGDVMESGQKAWWQHLGQAGHWEGHCAKVRDELGPEQEFQELVTQGAAWKEYFGQRDR